MKSKLNYLAWMFLREEGEGFGRVLTTFNSSILILSNWRDLQRENSIKIFDQMNYQIYHYHINKITNYEKTNYSLHPYLILKTSK